MKFRLKTRSIIILACLVSVVVIFILAHCMKEYSITGTYSAGFEPDKKNIYMVLHYNEEFTIYNQEKVLANGHFEPVTQKNKSNIYCLISEDNAKVGHVFHDKNQVLLLGFEGKDVLLTKISQNPIY